MTKKAGGKLPEESICPKVGLDVILGGEVLLGLDKSQATTHQHRDSLGEENFDYPLRIFLNVKCQTIVTTVDIILNVASSRDST